MSLSYGFYNSKDGDRKYDAIQMSSIFDGIIVDGMLMHYGGRMVVSATGDDMVVRVATGRAWFDHTWTLNDAILPLTVPQSEVIMKRIDAVVIDVDARLESRKNDIKIVKGAPAENPVRPTLLNERDHHQYPLAYIDVAPMATTIRQADITNMVGTSSCPYCTSPLEKMDIDELIAQWLDQWDAFYEQETTLINNQRDAWNTQWESYYTQKTDEINAYFEETQETVAAWMLEEQQRWIEWFETVQDVVDENAAVRLAAQILALETKVNDYISEADTKFENLETKVTALDSGYKAGDQAIRDELAAGTLKPAEAVHAASADSSGYATSAGSAGSATTAGNVTGTVDVAHGGTGATTAANARTNLGVAYGTTAGTVCEGNDTRLSNARTPTAHNQAASTITAGTLPVGVVATNSTDYTTSRLRNIQASTVDLVAGSSALANGAIYLVYE